MRQPTVSHTQGWPRPTHWLRKDGRWGEVYHGAALISYHYWKDSPVDFDADVIFGDSGGYSVVTQGAQIDPEEVIRWQCRVCTRGVMLDIPPYRPSSSIQFSGAASQFWDESMVRTKLNVQRALPHYAQYLGSGGQRFAWWGVIQGETREQMEEWYHQVAAIYPFEAPEEGWALAPKPSNDLLSNTRYLKFAHDRGLRRVHLLQVTSPRTLGVLFALANLSGEFDLVTFDSASAVRNAVNRGGIRLRELTFDYAKEKREYGAIHEMMLSCQCRGCDWYREMVDQEKDLTEFAREYPRRIALHNHLMMVQLFDRLLERAKEDPDGLLRALLKEREYGTILREWGGESQAKTQHVATSLFDYL